MIEDDNTVLLMYVLKTAKWSFKAAAGSLVTSSGFLTKYNSSKRLSPLRQGLIRKWLDKQENVKIRKTLCLPISVHIEYIYVTVK